MTVSCGRVRRLLWPGDGPQAVTDDLTAAHRHLAGCADCRRFMGDMAAMKIELGRAAPKDGAPLEVRNRLYSSVARARTAASGPHGRPRWTWEHRALAGRAAVAAAVIVAVTALGAVLLSRRGGGDTFAELASEHALTLGGEGISSNDAAAVTAWLLPRVSFAARVPTFSNAVLEGARLCLNHCYQGVVIQYRIGPRLVSYYVVPQPGDTDLTPFGEFYESDRAGYHVVSWHEPGLLHVMVGNVPRRLLTGLAASCRRQFLSLHSEPLARDLS